MLTKVSSMTSLGLTPVAVTVETNVAEKGFPGFTIVGLASKAAEECKERVKTALINSDIEFPTAKITINLAPADLPKDGSAYDLPIAMGILSAMGEINLPEESCCFYGELSLDGSLRHTKGVFLLALMAKEQGIKTIYVPRLSANEASVVEDIQVIPVDTLKNIILHLKGAKIIDPLLPVAIKEFDRLAPEFDFSEIYGQESAKRALEIAAAGGHNLMMMGPPGAGKTMLSRAMPGILPPLSEKESLEVTKIFSITGQIPEGGSLVRHRPFRSPHHTTSQVGLIGGGSSPRPGEVSLAHRGVLFLDEFPEFSRTCLEAMRQPLEDGYVSISRAAGSLTFPAQFMLIAAANPCPCGFLGDPKHNCQCTIHQIAKYQKKLSGPILDRIDLHLTVGAVDINKLMPEEKETEKRETSVEIRKRVLRARTIQSQRFVGTNLAANADMKNKHIKQFAQLRPEANSLLKQAMLKFNLSARTYFRLIKVSRTIADLAGESEIKEAHVAEALGYRVKIDT